MKSSLFSILSIALSILLSFNLQAQDIPAKETALCWFNLTVEEDMYLTMELEPKTMLAILFQKDNPEAKALMGNSLAMIYKKVNEETDLTLLPVESLEGKVNYSKMGYPLASLKKASKKGDFSQYVRIEIEVSGVGKSTSTTSTGGDIANESQRVKIKPQVLVNLKFGDADGYTIDKIQGKYRHEEKVEITSESLTALGWSYAYEQEADIIPYYYFLEKAVEDLVSKLK